MKVPGGPSRTYEELDTRSSQLANALRGMGLEPGDRIAGWMDDSVEYVELYVAVAKANLIIVPLNAKLTHHEAAYQLERTRARALVYTAQQAERVEELPMREDLLLIAALPELDRYGGDVVRGSPSSCVRRVAPHAAADDPWVICFTSGTTGRPKGAMLTHRSSMTLALTQHIALRIPVGGVNIRGVSLSFPATVQSHTISHLVAGGTDVLAAGGWDSERLLGLVAEERATHIHVPGPVLSEFTEAAAANPSRWQTLTSVLHAGQRADPHLLESLADVIGPRYLEGWGMTEISGGCGTVTVPSDVLFPPANFFESCGRPLPGTMVVAVDESRQVLPADREAIGELALLSPSIFAGYWDDPAATAEVLTDGWYFSGDVGSVDERGYVYISDRRTNLILSGGMNIYPAEVEMILERCPGVAECAVVAGPHPRWGQTPVAVVVRSPDTELSAEEVIDFAVEHLARYKKPTRVLFVEEIPRTAGGKIARGRLREQLADSVAEDSTIS